MSNWTIKSDTYLLNPNLEVIKPRRKKGGGSTPNRGAKVQFEEVPQVKRFIKEPPIESSSDGRDYNLTSESTDYSSLSSGNSVINVGRIRRRSNSMQPERRVAVKSSRPPKRVAPKSSTDGSIESVRSEDVMDFKPPSTNPTLQVCIHRAMEDAPLPNPRLNSPVDRARKSYFTPEKRKASMRRQAGGNQNKTFDRIDDERDRENALLFRSCSDLICTKPNLQTADIIVPIIEKSPIKGPLKVSPIKLKYPRKAWQNVAEHQLRVNSFMEKHEGKTIPKCYIGLPANCTTDDLKIKVLPRQITPFDPFGVSDKKSGLVCTRCVPRVKYFIPYKNQKQKDTFDPRFPNPKCWPFERHLQMRNSYLNDALTRVNYFNYSFSLLIYNN